MKLEYNELGHNGFTWTYTTLYILYYLKGLKPAVYKYEE